jgi:molybdopterin/thiamine biosynthesis adenylyltransferase
MFAEFPEYVNTDNISEVIQEDDIVFIGVDNHATRKIISEYVQKSVNNITVISGGNEYTDGNVQIYIRKEGKDLTPSLTAYHPEIETPGDKSPEDMSCQELAESAPQLLFTNLTVATIMCWVFYRLVKTEDIPGLGLDKSEVYFDIVSMSVLSKTREVPNV